MKRSGWIGVGPALRKVVSGCAFALVVGAVVACFSLRDLGSFPCADDGTCPSADSDSKQFYCGPEKTCLPCTSNMACESVGDTLVACDPLSGCGTQACVINWPVGTFCVDAGTGRQGDPCGSHGEPACAPGYECVSLSNGTCQQLCDLGDPRESGPLQCPSGQSCQPPVLDWGSNSGHVVNGILYGVCAPCQGADCIAPSPAQDGGTGLEAGSCNVTGTWTETNPTCTSTWQLTPEGNGVWAATETGCASVTGTATVNGTTLTLQWQDSSTNGEYVVSLNADCSSGMGTVTTCASCAPIPTEWTRTN